jgi:hypothetical protein
VRVILDECLPRRLAREITGHDVTTVPQAGLAGLSNGALLARIDGAFDAFVTIDRNLPAQNSLAGRKFGVIALRAHSNAIETLRPLAPRIVAALQSLKPGEAVLIDAS